MMRRFMVGAIAISVMAGLIFVGGASVSAGRSAAPPSSSQPSQSAQSAQPVQSTSYVALGDSVAAGAGLPLAANATVEDTACARSNVAYPALVARQLGQNVTQLACSGAKLDDGVFEEQARGELAIPPQLDRAYASGAPELITMTVGANDARWIQLLYQCYLSDCDTTATTAASTAFFTDMRLELDYVLRQINSRASGDTPTVLVTGYYNPLSERDCFATERITAGEWEWIDERADALNNVILNTVKNYSFAQFVPVDFAGHGVCSSDPWVQDLTDEAPFHPTADGHAAIAEAVVNAYNQASTESATQPTQDTAATTRGADSMQSTGFSLQSVMSWLQQGRAT